MHFARELSAEGVALARQQGQPVFECEATIVYVRCLRALGGGARGEIETLLAHALELIDQTGAERWRPHLHVERAELNRLAGDSDGAHRASGEAHRLFVEMAATGHAESISHEIVR